MKTSRLREHVQGLGLRLCTLHRGRERREPSVDAQFLRVDALPVRRATRLPTPGFPFRVQEATSLEGPGAARRRAHLQWLRPRRPLVPPSWWSTTTTPIARSRV